MIIKVERDASKVRAELILEDEHPRHWMIEGRRAGALVVRYRVSAHAAMVDVFAGLLTTAAEMEASK